MNGESKRCGLNNPCHTQSDQKGCVGTVLLNEWIAVLEIIIYKLVPSVVLNDWAEGLIKETTTPYF